MSDPAPTSLVIVGAGGHGRETLDVVQALAAERARRDQPTPNQLLGFCDDGPLDATALDRLARRDVPLLGGIDWLAGRALRYVVALGDCAVRRSLVQRIAQLAPHSAAADPLVHPDAVLGSDLRLAPGVIIAAGAHLTTNVELGAHTHCNVRSVVSHDCTIGDFCTISPGALVNGNVRLGDGVFLGTGAVVLPGRRIGAGAMVGAGAVVCDDVAPGRTVKGVPAR